MEIVAGENACYMLMALISLKMEVMTTGIAGGLISPKRALLLAPLKGLLGDNPILNKIWGCP